jgi:hypothetical protein
VRGFRRSGPNILAEHLYLISFALVNLEERKTESEWFEIFIFCIPQRRRKITCVEPTFSFYLSFTLGGDTGHMCLFIWQWFGGQLLNSSTISFHNVFRLVFWRFYKLDSIMSHRKLLILDKTLVPGRFFAHHTHHVVGVDKWSSVLMEPLKNKKKL